MATFLLVQPAWMGGWCWHKVARDLRRRGHDVSAPTLTGLGERAHLATRDVGLRTHVDDVVAVAEFDDLRDIVLVGTSSGGTVITGAASKMADRLAALVYLDAFLPADGQCTFDQLPPDRRAVLEGLVETEGDGWVLPRFAPPPWPVILREMWRVTDEADLNWMLPRLRPTPARHFRDPVSVAPGAAAPPRRVYVRCVGGGMPSPFDAVAASVKGQPGWEYREIDAPHVPYVTHPADVTSMLEEVATR